MCWTSLLFKIASFHSAGYRILFSLSPLKTLLKSHIATDDNSPDRWERAASGDERQRRGRAAGRLRAVRSGAADHPSLTLNLCLPRQYFDAETGLCKEAPFWLFQDALSGGFDERRPGLHADWADQSVFEEARVDELTADVRPLIAQPCESGW
ncbi:protein of unknown function [Methylocaldum szegediense]|uniref:Uncharacterized protein n=1 Tax=Methylocaldum szegediense TaxID=73780 RepID=A0ABN8X7P3_9GAMM|nr:protein of unknown function [Methylocaldum szegediense]